MFNKSVAPFAVSQSNMRSNMARLVDIYVTGGYATIAIWTLMDISTYNGNPAKVLKGFPLNVGLSLFWPVMWPMILVAHCNEKKK